MPKPNRCALLSLYFIAATLHLAGQTNTNPGPVNLPSSKQLILPLPGAPQKINSLPMAMAQSPDGRYLAIVNAGYGTAESRYLQSIAVVDTQTGKIADFPDDRTAVRFAHQTLYAGLAFSRDGKHLYASLDSLTAPTGGGNDATGNAIAVYSFNNGVVASERLLPIPLQKLAPGKSQAQLKKPIPAGMAIPSPAGLTVVAGPSGEDRILVADNLSDDALLLDARNGGIITRYDLSDSATVPAAFPIAVAATKDGKRGFVALWNGSAVAELDLRNGKLLQTLPLEKPTSKTGSSSHPTAFALDSDEKTLYVALANRDMIAAVGLDSNKMKLNGLFDAHLEGQQYFGAVSNSLALSADGKRLYAANASSNSVAVFDTEKLKDDNDSANAPVKAEGFIPTGWYPTGVALAGNKLYIATAKGQGTGPNNFPQKRVPGTNPRFYRENTYIGTLLYGSLAGIDTAEIDHQLPKMTAEVRRSNLLGSAQEKIAFHAGANPIKHVIYIIKENRTYDQVFGDIKGANGDPSLTMYGQAITPNEHKLAEQFGVLDNFYDSGEVSGDGHVWSNAAITSDYTEKTWQQSYRGGERMYDFEGVVAEGYPLLQGIPDVNEPDSGYLWTNLAKHNKTYYHFGEYVSTKFCGEASNSAAAAASPLEGTPEPGPASCPHPAIRKGEPIPANYGGGVSPYPWPIPLIAKDIATKPELEGHFDPQYPDFNLQFPDQLRFEEFQTRFKQWVAARKGGRDTMPQFINLRFPNDHTAGTRPGSPTPKASVADNDLAVGRAVDLISHSLYWNDTAFFILEDDAQAGADHVDAHRSIALVVSKYAPPPKNGTPFVDHTFYTTVSMIHTMENLLDLPPMNQNDALAPLIGSEFSGEGTQPAYQADYANRDNGLIYAANTPKSPGANESSKLDLRHADQADTQKLNAILWRDAMGNRPLPNAIKYAKPQPKDDDAN